MNGFNQEGWWGTKFALKFQNSKPHFFEVRVKPEWILERSDYCYHLISAY